MSNTLANEAHQRSLKDFLTLYNTITEFCFDKCVSNFNERNAESNETMCVDICTDNYVQYNQRFMFNFVDHQERRKKDQERIAVEAAAKEAAAAQAATTEHQSPTSEGQHQVSTQLDPLSSGTSSGFSSVSALSSTDGTNASQSSLSVEGLKGDPVAASDTYGAVDHAGNVRS